MHRKWEKILLDTTLFDQISEADLHSMLQCLQPIIEEHKKDTIIALEGDKYKGVGIVLSGRVSIAKESASGAKTIMGFSGPGELFGEVAAFSGHDQWPATVYAHEQVSIMFLPPQVILGECPKMCNSHRTMIANLLRVISRRALSLNKQIEYLTKKTIRAKLAYYLWEIYMEEEKNTFLLPLKRNELAQLFNVSRPSLSREMIRLKEAGIIDFHMSAVHIKNLDELANLADQN